MSFLIPKEGGPGWVPRIVFIPKCCLFSGPGGPSECSPSSSSPKGWLLQPPLTAPCPYSTAGSGYKESLQEGKPLITNISCLFAPDPAYHSPSPSGWATNGGRSNVFTNDLQRRVPRPVSSPDSSPSTPVSLLWGAHRFLQATQNGSVTEEMEGSQVEPERKKRRQRQIRIFSSNRKCNRAGVLPPLQGLLSVSDKERKGGRGRHL